MKKLFVQALVLLLLFFGSWHLLKQINWLGMFPAAKNLGQKAEDKLAILLWENIENTETSISTPAIQKPLDKLLEEICKSNQLPSSELSIHIIQKNQVNAFAFPGGHIVLYSELIKQSDTPEALAGVIAHELAHIQLRHVTQKLIKEIGLSVLVAAGTGSSTAGNIISEAIHTLSSTAFDRAMERQADLQAVTYLMNAGVDGEAFAHFLEKLAQIENENKKQRYPSWLSTHHDSKERASYIRAHGSKRSSSGSKSIMDKSTWESLQRKLENY